MKHLNKIVLIVMLLSSISTSAQIERISIDVATSMKPIIKIENGKIFVSHPNGVIFQRLAETGLDENWSDYSSPWRSSLIKGIPVSDFYFNGDKAIGITPYSYLMNRFLVRTEDGGETYTITNFPGIEEDIEFLLQNPIDKDKLVVISDNGNTYHSYDFGKSWEAITTRYRMPCISAKYHPTDPNVLIIGVFGEEEYQFNSDFLISFDEGKTWRFIDVYFDGAVGIAYHYSNPDVIVVSGWKVKKSTDRGKSWETILEGGGLTNKPEYTANMIEFDKRGSDRMYGTKWDTKHLKTQNQLYYSDDFGVTWNELCQLNLEEGTYISDFEQYNSKIYVSTTDINLYEIDLELLESAIEEVPTDASDVAVSIANGTLQVVSQSQVSTIEVFNIGGVKMQSIENAGSLDISDLAKGTYVARVSTTDGKTISRKFNK